MSGKIEILNIKLGHILNDTVFVVVLVVVLVDVWLNRND